MSQMKNIRSRHTKSNPSDFILTTDEDESNEKENNSRLITRKKHDQIQICLMILTAICYLIRTLRTYIPLTNSRFWTNLAARPITRVYTSDLRPSIVEESLLFFLAENWQTVWLLYILSYIPRQTSAGYLYTNPNIYNSFFCINLITALAFQTASQSSPSPEISCACLYVSLILFIIVCRNLAMKVYVCKPQDFSLVQYFILNSLFLYTTSILYLSICATVEYIGIHLDPSASLPTTTSICTTIGLLMVFIFVFIYFLFDRFIYENEFWSIWTPYFFLLYAFLCPPLRQISFLDNELVFNQYNFYLLWIVFGFILFILGLRLYRQISNGYRKQKKVRISSHIEEITSGLELEYLE